MSTLHVAEVLPPQIEDPVSDAEMVDLRFIAQQEGISTGDAIERYGWNDNFSMAVDKIRQLHPGSFSGADIVSSNLATVSFKESIPDGVEDVMRDFALAAPSVEVRLRDNVGYSESEIVKAIEEVHYSTLTSQYVDDVVTFFDSEKLSIRSSIRAVKKDQATREVLIQDADDVLRDLGMQSRGITIEIVYASEDSVGGNDGNLHHHGGEALSNCTSGFGIRTTTSTSGSRGISTAGHCDDKQNDDSYSLSFKEGHEGTYGDFQWHIGAAVTLDDFYAGSSTVTETTLRDVASVGSPVVGQMLCKNGKTNHRSCQEVRKLYICKGIVCNLVQMESRLAAPGDSGGPIYYGNTAYGLHHGWMYDPNSPHDRDLFSRADLIDDALGIFIATN